MAKNEFLVSPLPIEPAAAEPYGNPATFGRLICEEIRRRNARTVLDIGAGRELIDWLRPIRREAATLVGIDPDEAVVANPHLDLALLGRVEDVDAGALKADIAYSFNVVEHIERPRPFLQRVNGFLKPGGSFWFFSTNEWHPFCLIGHVIRLGRVKGYYRFGMSIAGHTGINEYPSYYRLNRVGRIARLARSSGFSQLHYALLPSSWEAYVPSALRFAPRMYDALVQRWIPAGRLILMCRLVK